jgi:hypothetical protein
LSYKLSPDKDFKLANLEDAGTPLEKIKSNICDAREQ